jgi:hypothetical protein
MRETAAGMREKLFTMRMSQEESARLDVVAAHYGLNAAGVIRMLVKREFDAAHPGRGPELAAKGIKPGRERRKAKAK